MTDISKRYFAWLSAIVSNDPTSKRESYKCLLEYLFNKKFVYTQVSDMDRAKDGVYLRNLYSPDLIMELNHELGDCRVLEMMIALARRCEMDTMYNNLLGNRTGQWFWEMIASLKLGQMNDAEFDVEYVDMQVTNFMSRRYKVNGEGGLFTITNLTDDMRKLSIWKQMNLYLNEVLMDEGLLHYT